jgi:hypothetical protein
LTGALSSKGCGDCAKTVVPELLAHSADLTYAAPWGLGEFWMTELTPERAYKYLVAALKLIPAKERAKAFAAAMRELDGQKQHQDADLRAVH